MRPPLLPADRIVKALQRAGYRIIHQKGSHIKLCNESRESTFIVPNHKEVDRWTLKGILRDAGINVSEFLKLL